MARNVNIVGLGGTGADIIRTFITAHREEVLSTLRNEQQGRISCLAIDVADNEIRSLRTAYEELQQEMDRHGIQSDRVALITHSVKFPSRDVMFNFINNFPEHVRREGLALPSDYRPWITDQAHIPPLPEGVGRQRYLSKAIYLLNYSFLQTIGRSMEQYANRIIQSGSHDPVFLVYGLGGGSGSGMVLELARHLRQKVGANTPLFGLSVLPCHGDQAPAREQSPFAALMEHRYSLNRGLNKRCQEQFGEYYRNPFDAFFMMPLGPAFGVRGDVLEARRLVDDAIVDILLKQLHFDLADMFTSIGVLDDPGDSWINLIASVRIAYPVAEYIDILTDYVSEMDRRRDLRREKLEILGGRSAAQSGGVMELLNYSYEELESIYADYLSERGRYDESEFPKQVQAFISEDSPVEEGFMRHLRNIDEALRNQVEELRPAIETIGLDAQEGTPEQGIKANLDRAVNEFLEMPRNFNEGGTSLRNTIDTLSESLGTMGSTLQPKEQQVIRDAQQLAQLVLTYGDCFYRYLEVRAFADRLNRLISQAERSSSQQRALQAVQRINTVELPVCLGLLNSIFQNPRAELSQINDMVNQCALGRRSVAREMEQVQGRLDSLNAERNRLRREAQEVEESVGRGLLSRILRGKAREEAGARAQEIRRNVQRLDTQISSTERSISRLRDKQEVYSTTERRFQGNSEYRRALMEIIEIGQRRQEKRNSIVDQGLYNRTAELTPHERSRILREVLQGNELQLSQATSSSGEETRAHQEEIINRVIDRSHFREVIKDALSVFRNPSSIGVGPNYRTDSIWFTISSPRQIWGEELEEDVRANFLGYIRTEAQRAINFEHRASTDPWTMRILIVCSKARPEDLANFEGMKFGYLNNSGQLGPIAPHSFLLEQGIKIGPEGELVHLWNEQESSP